MEIKLLDLKKIKGRESKELFEKLKYTDSIPVYDGNYNRGVALIFMFSKFRIYGDILYATLSIENYLYDGIMDLSKERLSQIFDGDDALIKFKAVKNNKNEIEQFLLVNKYTDNEKKREDMISKSNSPSNRIQDGDLLLSINMNLRIPKGFDGGVEDAVLSLYNYMRSTKDYDGEFEPNEEDTLLQNWFTMVNTTNRRLIGDICIKEMSKGELKPYINEK